MILNILFDPSLFTQLIKIFYLKDLSKAKVLEL